MARNTKHNIVTNFLESTTAYIVWSAVEMEKLVYLAREMEPSESGP